MSNSIFQPNKSNKKIILITGATAGIGKETAIELVKDSQILILPVRSITKGESLKEELKLINNDCKIDLWECNLNSIQSMKEFSDNVLKTYPKIDILINNAGVMNVDRIITVDGFEETFQVNVISQFIFNTKFLPLLKASDQARIINLSSIGNYMGKFRLETVKANEALKSKSIREGSQMYYDSNLYRNLLTLHLAKILKETKNNNITVNALHPGAIKTDLGAQNEGFLSKILIKLFQSLTKPTKEGAKTTIYLARSEEGGKISGKYWDNCKVKEPSKASTDDTLAQKLWQYLESKV
jgi:NAD(P)-dependent dehydrogenase (short-subunit alcohol dehydrogenase family)